MDISGRRSKDVDEFQGQSFDYVLTAVITQKKAVLRVPVTQNASTGLRMTRQRFKARKGALSSPFFAECGMKFETI